MSFLRFFFNFIASVHTKFIRILAFLIVLQAGSAFASSSEEKNPYSEIRELSYSKFGQLFEDYINKKGLKNQYGFYTEKTSDVIHFLEQFVNLEKLHCGFFRYPCKVDLEKFTKNPPRLPNLKSLILDREFASHDLDWIVSYSSLESLTICDFCGSNKEIDVTPLQAMEHLLNFKLLWGTPNAKVVHANRLPLSLQSLCLDDCCIDPMELNHLKLKKLELNSKSITNLPEKSALAGLEYLDLSGSAISNLSAIEGNQNLKIFMYCYPRGSGLKANFSILSTLSNLEELDLAQFPQRHEDLENAIRGLSKLQKLTLTGPKLFNLSFLEGFNLSKLAVEARLLNLIPDSILGNPSLIDVETTELELLDSTFSWNRLSPNMRYLDLGYSDFCDFSELSRFPLVSLMCEAVDCINNEAQLIAFAPTLESLTCKGSTIYSVINIYGDDILASFAKLKCLNIDFGKNNKFNSLNFLKKFPLLEELEIRSARELPVEAFDVFLEIKNLKNISIIDGSVDIDRKIWELLKKDIPITKI